LNCKDVIEKFLTNAWTLVVFRIDPSRGHEVLIEILGKEFSGKLCEQSIRRVVLNRKITQGTRSDWGNRWWERIWSVLATCEQQGRNVMEFLKSCMHAWIHGLAPPALMKD